MKSVCELEVDGGIDPATAHICADEGANVFVAGSAVFGNRTGVAAAMQDLRFALQPVTQ